VKNIYTNKNTKASSADRRQSSSILLNFSRRFQPTSPKLFTDLCEQRRRTAIVKHLVGIFTALSTQLSKKRLTELALSTDPNKNT
jgi:hypothetical protein